MNPLMWFGFVIQWALTTIVLVVVLNGNYLNAQSLEDQGARLEGRFNEVIFRVEACSG